MTYYNNKNNNKWMKNTRCDANECLLFKRPLVFIAHGQWGGGFPFIIARGFQQV